MNMCTVTPLCISNDKIIACSLQSSHSKGIWMITSIWNLPREPYGLVCIPCHQIYIYIYIRGVMFTKFTVQFDTTQWCHVSVCFRYGVRGNWLRCNAGNISVLNREGEPMDITQARVCARVCTLQTKCKIYAGERLNLSHYTISRK